MTELTTPTAFSTAEGLIIETLSVGVLAGTDRWVFDKSYWIKPHLDRLERLGLVTWEYDDNADYLVVVTPEFVRSDLTQAVARKQGLPVA